MVRLVPLVLALLWLWSGVAVAQERRVFTVVGGLGAGYDPPKDGAPATSVTLYPTTDVAVGPDGSILLLQGASRLWKVDPGGRIARLAGRVDLGPLGTAGPRETRGSRARWTWRWRRMGLS